MFTDEKLREITDKIVKKHQPEKIILFGSYAWGKPGPDSDIDLFIIKDTNNPRELARAIDRAIFPRQFPLDILVYTPSEVEKKIKEERNLFIEDIVKNGEIIYERT